MSEVGARDVLARSGFALDDTSLVVYFDAADPGLAEWTSWRVSAYDPDTGAVQESRELAPSEAKTCGAPRRYCNTLGAAEGWSLTDGHGYFVAVTVTFKNGDHALSPPSGVVKARTTTTPPPLPPAQAAGCACGNAFTPSTAGQMIRGSGVNTGTGAFTLSTVDLRMAGFGVPFQAQRRYSSANTGSGSLGIGWSWTLDLRLTPPAEGQTAVTVRAEDGSQAVFSQSSDGSYVRPPGVRSTLAKDENGWRLVTPQQQSYAFDQQGRLTSVRNSRGLGLTITYTTDKWTITDAPGRKVTAEVGGDGLIRKITLPDGRSTAYHYDRGLLTGVTDASGSRWKYGYGTTSLTTLTDPQGRVQVVNTYADGRVAKQSDALRAITTFAWDATKQEGTTVDPDGVSYVDGYRGNVLVYSQNGNGDTLNQRYNAAIDPVLQVDAQGNQATSTFDPAGNVTSTTAPEPFGHTTSNGYDAHNNLTKHVDALGHEVSYGYDAFDQLRTITDAMNGQTVLTVDDRGLVTAQENPLHKVTTSAYDIEGNLVARTTPMGEKTVFAYDKVGRPVATTDPRGTVAGANPADYTTRWVYDELDRLRKTFAPGKRQPEESVYDSVGQLIRTVDATGHGTGYRYGKVLSLLVSSTDADGRSTGYTYTKAGRRSSITDPAGGRTTYTYDVRGNLAAEVSPRGNAEGANRADFTTTYAYDFNNNLVRVSHPYPGGGFAHTDAVFDELNRRVATIDPLGKTAKTGYDSNGNVVSVMDPLGHTATVTYDANGRQTSTIRPGGDGATAEYDAAGHMIKNIAAAGGVTTWTYNDNGDAVTAVDPRGNTAGANPADYTTKFGYDAARNQVSVTDPLGGTTKTTFDGNNRRTGVTDANGHLTRYQYDDADRVVRVAGPDALATTTTYTPATTYTYDGAGHTTSRTDPNGHLSAYRYDLAGRVDAITDPVKRQTAFQYDPEGNLVRAVAPGSGDPVGRTTSLTYDILGRRVGQDLGGAVMYAWGYDARNLPASLADRAGVRTQTYDDAGRLTAVSRGPGQAFGYEYGVNGDVTARTWPDGTRLTAEFDASSQLTALTAQGGAAGPQAATYTFHYDRSGRLEHTDYPGQGSLATDRAYDRAGRLVDVDSHGDGGTVSRYQITRDAVGNPTSIVTTRGTDSQTSAYTYDAADRVASQAGPARKVEYRYDLVGNMLGQTTSGSVSSGTAYRYDDADQMLEAVTRGTGAGTVKYRYDEQGNQVQAGGDTFTYNLDHTTATATVGGVRTSYTYDAQRLRLSAVTDAANGPRSKAWAQDVNASLPRLALETTSTPSSSTSRGFLNGAKGAALGLLTGGRADVFVPDWLGGVADVVSPDGATVASYDYEPYGAARTDGTAAGRPSSVDNPIRFTGAYQDTTIGSRYTFPARNYDPATGRFATLDPVGAGSATPATSGYAYAAGRPTTATDPSGAIPIIPPGPVFTPRVTGPECSAATPEYCHSPGSNKKTAHDLGVEWLSGAIAGCPDGSTGSCYTEELFREKDKFTNQIREMKSFHQSVDRVAEQLPYTRAGEGGNENYHFAQMTPEERRDIAERTGRSIFTSGAQGMSIALAFLGSYDLDWKFLGNDDNFNPVVEFHLTNASTKGSASLDPGKVQDYGEDSSAGDGHDAQPGERWLHQSVRWRETFPDGKAPKLPTGKQTVPCPPLGMTCEHDPDSYDRTFPWWFPLPQLPELWPM